MFIKSLGFISIWFIALSAEVSLNMLFPCLSILSAENKAAFKSEIFRLSSFSFSFSLWKFCSSAFARLTLYIYLYILLFVCLIKTI